MSIQSVNPATEEILETLEPTSAQEIDRILARAHAAFLEWRTRPFAQRASLMRGAAKALRAGKAEYALTMTREMGKPIVQAEAEVEKCAVTCDYYAEHASKYSFDQAGYLEAALERASPAERALVVSDDAEWCRSNLHALIRSYAPSVDYAEPDPLANFRAVAGASRIIGTNSTFTYWAAYVAGVIHPDAEVIMPQFHARMVHGTDAHQLDPRWKVIDGFH